MVAVRILRTRVCACGAEKTYGAVMCMKCYRAMQAADHGTHKWKRVPKRCGCLAQGRTRTPWHCACTRWKLSTDTQCKACAKATESIAA